MVLYKATCDGEIPMTAEEEAEIKAQWAQGEKDMEKPKPPSLEERVAALETKVNKLIEK